MNKITKKIIIYSIVGMMQAGVGTAILEASPGQGDQKQPGYGQQDQRQDQENQRHNQEMKKHEGENDRDWHERQRQENNRHNENMKNISNNR